MLNYFRHHSLRKSLWLVILLGSLLTTTQNLYACEFLHNGVQTTCCCDEDMKNGCAMGGGDKASGGVCEMSDTGKPTSCCDVSTDITVGLSDVAIADSHHHKQLLALDVLLPLPDLILVTNLNIPSPAKSDTYDFTLSTSPSGTHTYLTTHRFRI